MMFQWDDKLYTGIASIDDQHQKLISLVNALHDAMRAKKAREVIGDILVDLSEYTKYHFSNEESLFRTYGYPQLEAHRAHHAQLVDQLMSLIDKHKKNELTISIDTLDFLIGWVTNHIMQEDMKYVPFLKDKVS